MSKQEIIGNIYFYKAGVGSKKHYFEGCKREKQIYYYERCWIFFQKECRDKNEPERL